MGGRRLSHSCFALRSRLVFPHGTRAAADAIVGGMSGVPGFRGSEVKLINAMVRSYSA